jgi:hypothetical protein
VVTSENENQEGVDNIVNRMVLYGILTKYIAPGETVFRYRLSETFRHHIDGMMEVFDTPEGAKVLKNIFYINNKEGDDRKGNLNVMMPIISRFLSTQRVVEERLATLPDWEKNSTTQEYSIEEINDKYDELFNTMDKRELYDMARTVCDTYLP